MQVVRDQSMRYYQCYGRDVEAAATCVRFDAVLLLVLIVLHSDRVSCFDIDSVRRGRFFVPACNSEIVLFAHVAFARRSS